MNKTTSHLSSSASTPASSASTVASDATDDKAMDAACDEDLQLALNASMSTYATKPSKIHTAHTSSSTSANNLPLEMINEVADAVLSYKSCYPDLPLDQLRTAVYPTALQLCNDEVLADAIVDAAIDWCA